MGKRCFVTIGATASFNGLVQAVLEPAFLKLLHEAKYTELRIQYGDEGRKIFEERLKDLKGSSNLSTNIEITGFGFNDQGLQDEMIAVKGGSSKSDEGVVISHAGSGSILDVMRIGLPLIVVPNTKLLGNHQAELAEELARRQYVSYGRLDNLQDSIVEIEQFRTMPRQWPPSQSRGKGFAGVVAEEMGWLD